jgi:hypothetical protein
MRFYCLSSIPRYNKVCQGIQTQGIRNQGIPRQGKLSKHPDLYEKSCHWIPTQLFITFSGVTSCNRHHRNKCLFPLCLENISRGFCLCEDKSDMWSLISTLFLFSVLLLMTWHLQFQPRTSSSGAGTIKRDTILWLTPSEIYFCLDILARNFKLGNFWSEANLWGILFR